MNRAQQLYEFVARDPGRKPSSYTYALGWGRGTAQSILADAESSGILFAEDDKGNLYPGEKLTPKQVNTLNSVYDGIVENRMRRFWKEFYEKRNNPRID